MANFDNGSGAEAAPSTEEDNGKVSQQEANYRMGSRVRSCGLCQYFTGSDGPGAYACTKVDGEISPYGFSDLYGRQDNPFIAGVQESFDAENTTEDAAPDEESEPRLRIGNRSY